MDDSISARILRVSDMINSTLTVSEERQSKHGFIGIPSGYPTLDHIIGGWNNGDLVLISSRPAVGKTTLGLNLARNAAVLFGIPTVFIPLEGSAASIVNRLVVAETGIEWDKLLGRIMMTKEDWPSLETSLASLASSPLYILDSWRTTITELRNNIVAAVRDKGASLVIIDYVQLLRLNSGKRIETCEEMTIIIQSLKEISQELHISIIILSQLKACSSLSEESSRDYVPYLISGKAVVSFIDIVMTLQREACFEFEDSSSETAFLSIERNPYGQLANIELRYDTKRGAFMERSDILY